MEMNPNSRKGPGSERKSEAMENSSDEVEHDPTVSYEVKKRKFVYDILDKPPIHLVVFFGLQQALLSLSLNLTTSLLVADAACGFDNELLKAELLSTTLFASGISTLLMVTVGVRLPIYQGPAMAFVTPLVALKNLADWKCPNSEVVNNSTITDGFNQTLNISTLPPVYVREEAMLRLQMMQGSLMVAGVFQTLLGVTGLIGRILRFIGPITVVPVLLLIGISIYKTAVKFCNAHWGVALLTFAVAMGLSLYLEGRQTPIPFWNKERGFHITYYPLHTVFSLLIAIIVGWLVSIVLTMTGSLSDDPKSAQFFARTDSRVKVIEEANWFYFPYPGQFGPPRFNLDVFVTFFIATLISVIDSVGDYYAVARICDVPPPPTHAVNRGILAEGVMSTVAGSLGAGHATTSYGPNIGAIGFTRVASLRVFVACGITYIIFGVIGKIGAFFITMPYSVLGGVSMVSFGMFIGFNFANLIPVQLNARNMSILGIAIFFGIMMPHWSKTHSINTGILDLDRLLNAFISNTMFTGGFIACVLDNTVSGTLEERGLKAWLDETVGQSQTQRKIHLYEVPYLQERLGRYKWAKYIPFMSGYGKSL
ncbi:solute carrier family 23 member 2-like [Ylistrum balloti]|uniref:solute carrier family 23 member 2-like n=1 Tax=Ylistrum balloti TaxID=509963 RepID=UPI002905B979|nr:solute carrier family 23 member 2-like [Ylistrum balloti]